MTTARKPKWCRNVVGLSGSCSIPKSNAVNKHVESLQCTCLDLGSTPSGSTKRGNWFSNQFLRFSFLKKPGRYYRNSTALRAKLLVERFFLKIVICGILIAQLSLTAYWKLYKKPILRETPQPILLRGADSVKTFLIGCRRRLRYFPSPNSPWIFVSAPSWMQMLMTSATSSIYSFDPEVLFST